MRPTSADISTTGLERPTLVRFRRAIVVGTAGTSGIALAGLLSYAPGMRLLGSIRPDYIPMAPSTAACFLVLSLALFRREKERQTEFGHRIVAALVLLVAAFGLLKFIGSLAGLDLTGEDWLTSALGTLGEIPIGRMSVATAAVFVIAALGTWLLGLRPRNAGGAARRGHVASSLGVLTVMCGGTVLLGYVFGTPFMYAGGTVPMAATTAAAFLCLGTALAATAGPASFPVTLVVGDSFEAWLSRVFLALTASSLLALGILTHAVSHWAPRNEALVTSALIVVTCAATAFVVARVVRRFGVRLADSEQLLQEREVRHAALVANIADVIVVIDKDGINRYKSPNVKRGFGWTPAELIGKSAFDTVHPDDVPALRTVFGALVSAPGTAATSEFRYRCKDGEYKWVEITVVNLLHDLTIAGFLGNYHDITARKRSEDELRQSEQRFRSYIESAPDGVFVINRAGFYQDVNAAGCRLLGYSRDDLLHMHASQVVPEEALGAARDSIQVVVREGAYSGELTFRRKDGSEFPGLLEATSISEDQYLGFLKDITERKQAEAARLHHAAELEESQRIARIGSWEWMIATNVITWSDAMNHLLARAPGAPPPTFAELPRFFAPEGWRQLEVAIPNAVESGTSYDLELEMIRSDGATLWTTTRGEAVRGEDGTVVKLRGTVLDITERKRVEEALQDSERHFKTMFEESPFGIALIDSVTGKILHVNPMFAKIAGRTVEQMATIDWMSITHPDDVQADLDNMARLNAGETTGFQMEKRYLRPGGDVVWIQMTIAALTSDETARRQHLAMIENITERRRAEAVLRLESAALAAAANAIVITDCEGVIEWTNAALGTITGYTNAEAVGRKPGELLQSGHHDAAFYRDMWNTILAGDVWHGEVVNKRKDGGLYTEEMTITPLKDERGEITHFIAVKQDITERKRLEEQFRQAQKMESVGLLAGGVAHDFNNMLGVILGTAELAIAQVNEGQPLHEDLLEIRRAAIRSADLTRQLLAFARQQTIAPVVLDLNETVPGMLAMLRRLIGEDISLRWQPTAALWPVLLDPSQMDQILTNLCVNARHAIADVGTVTIATANVVVDAAFCAAHAEAMPGDFAQLSVNDTGSGMDVATLARIFEPFFSTKGVGAGTGLGLATVYGAVKQNQGFVTVASTLGEGTTFEIYLPRHVGALTPARHTGPAAADLRGSETILVVEDEPSLIRLITKALEAQGYEVLAASSAAEALRLATAYADEIHLLVSDVVMPEMNGRDLAQALLKLRPTLKPLFMSGYTADVIATRGLLALETAFIEKPYTPVALAAKVREVLDGQ